MTHFHGRALVDRIKPDRGKRIYTSMCQAYCVTRANTGAVGDWDGDRAADAQDGWKKAKSKGKVVLAKNIVSYKDIPTGTFCYWEGGSRGYGHVAISIGGGKVQSTDAPVWGKVGVVDIGYIAKHWRNGLKFVGYVVVEGNGHRMVDATPSVPKPSKPASKGPWFTVGSYNLKSPTLTRSGNHKWTLRRARQIKNIATARLDVLCIQEEGSPTDVAWYDPQLKKLDLGRVAGNRWRYIYANQKTTKTIAAGVVELAPLYQGDTKPMPWWAGEIRGSFTLVGNLHLEEANGAKPDAIRPDQATDAVVELKKIAAHIRATKGINIPRDRWVFAGDTNSEWMVAERMDDRHGFVSALANAIKSSGSKYATFSNWVRNRLGRHVDYIFVDRSRPVESWTQKSDSVAADHNFIYATLGRKAQP